MADMRTKKDFKTSQDENRLRPPLWDRLSLPKHSMEQLLSIDHQQHQHRSGAANHRNDNRSPMTMKSPVMDQQIQISQSPPRSPKMTSSTCLIRQHHRSTTGDPATDLGHGHNHLSSSCDRMDGNFTITPDPGSSPATIILDMLIGRTLRKSEHFATRTVTKMSSSETTRSSDVADAVTSTAYVKRTDNPVVDCRLPSLVITNESTTSRLKSRSSSNPWQLLVAIFYLVLYITSSTCLAARQEAVTNCTFPQRWEGSWFLSGYQQSIHIKGSIFSYRGKCIASDGNKYLIVDDRGCHRCLVIYEKHKNVLQYKESECDGDSMYMDQSNPAAMPMRSILKSDHRGGAHPNLNGHSRLSSSDQYIMRSNDDINDCPLGYCKGRESLQNLCDQIPGDALLYSLFKENAEPVKCPLKGPFTFTYNRGHGECRSPVSNIESCTEDSRLLLSFQACPDVHGTESTVEELTCLATWKDGNSRYLVGLVSHHHAISNEERFRCFVYEKISSMLGGISSTPIKDAEYKLAQSGDATCNGLDSAEVGSRIMTLRKPTPAERCDFPAWFKGPRHWHALMGNAGYTFHQSDGSMHITKPTGYMETRALCEQINKQTPTEMMAVVHYTTGCQSGFMCMTFYRRDTHVAEIQMGEPASRLEDACAPDHFDINKLPYITLLASNTEHQICPLEGLYSLKGAIGPPYITSRHKRNHNNKGHNQHGHHHHEQGHKRHGTLSFRNSEEFGHTSWHSHTRGLPIRSRRAAASSAVISDEPHPPPSLLAAKSLISSTSSSPSASARTPESGPSNPASSVAVASQMPSTISKLIPGGGRLAISGSNGDIRDDSGNDGSRDNAILSDMGSQITITTQANETQRNRRDAPGCVVNYKAQRQLLVACTEPNVIEVRPQCNEDGDEEYSCHGSWTENGTVYIIARHKGTQHGVCISYRPLDGNSVKLVIGDACYRSQQKAPADHHLVANLTIFGKCGDTSSSNLLLSHWILVWIMTGLTLSIILFTDR